MLVILVNALDFVDSVLSSVRRLEDLTDGPEVYLVCSTFF